MELAAAKGVLARHAHLFLRAYIHGFAARGNPDQWSDVDLVLIRRTQLPFFDRIHEVPDLILDSPRSEVLIFTEDELRQLVDVRGSSFVRNVVGKGILVEGTQDRSPLVAATAGE